MKIAAPLLAAILLTISPSSLSAQKISAPSKFERYLHYAAETQELVGIHRCLVMAVLTAEGGTKGKDQLHSNGVVDTGIAQVRKGGEWMRYFLVEYGITYEDLRDREDIAILAIGYIIRKEYNRSQNIIEAVAAYHRGFGRRKSTEGYIYAKRVFSQMERNAQRKICV